jgi:hypothetical protein
VLGVEPRVPLGLYGVSVSSPTGTGRVIKLREREEGNSWGSVIAREKSGNKIKERKKTSNHRISTLKFRKE